MPTVTCDSASVRVCVFGAAAGAQPAVECVSVFLWLCGCALQERPSYGQGRRAGALRTPLAAPPAVARVLAMNAGCARTKLVMCVRHVQMCSIKIIACPYLFSCFSRGLFGRLAGRPGRRGLPGAPAGPRRRPQGSSLSLLSAILGRANHSHAHRASDPLCAVRPPLLVGPRPGRGCSGGHLLHLVPLV